MVVVPLQGSVPFAQSNLTAGGLRRLPTVASLSRCVAELSGLVEEVLKRKDDRKGQEATN